MNGLFYRYELIFNNTCRTNLKTVHTFRSFLYGAILDRPKNTALGGGGGKNTKQQAPQSKHVIQCCIQHVCHYEKYQKSIKIKRQDKYYIMLGVCLCASESAREVSFHYYDIEN